MEIYTKRNLSKCLTKILASICEEEMAQTTNRMLRAMKFKEILDEKKLSFANVSSCLNAEESQIEEWLAGNEDIPDIVFEKLI